MDMMWAGWVVVCVVGCLRAFTEAVVSDSNTRVMLSALVTEEFVDFSGGLGCWLFWFGFGLFLCFVAVVCDIVGKQCVPRGRCWLGSVVSGKLPASCGCLRLLCVLRLWPVVGLVR